MNFFVLQNPKAGEDAAVTDFLPVDGSRSGEAPRCTLCGKHIGMLPLLAPVRVELEIWGTSFGDVAYGPSGELLLSERFWKLYESSGLTGLIAVAPAEVVKLKAHRKLREPPPRYNCCRVDRSRAAVDDLKSGLDREDPVKCEECRLGGIIKRVRRVVLEDGSWSGEHVFLARGLPGAVMASEKFERLCLQNGITNCKLVPAEAYSFDHYPWEKANAAIPP